MDCTVSIGVATLNGPERLDRTLASIKRCTPAIDYKVIVIDDGSTERNLVQNRLLCKEHGVEFQEHRRNLGIPATWNHLVAFRFACEYVALLNDDVEVTDGWLEALTFFAARNECATVALHPIQDGKIVVCGGGQMEPTASEASVPHRVVAANGYCFLFRPELWKELGGFDEGYFSFYEEVDFGVRAMKEKGLSSFNIPWPHVKHEWSSTFQQNADLLLPTVRMKASKEYFLKKWKKDAPELAKQLKDEVPALPVVTWLTPAGSASCNANMLYEVDR